MVRGSIQTLTVKEAAKILDMTERAVWMRIYRKEIPHKRWGRKVLLLRNDLEDFIRNLGSETIKKESGKENQNLHAYLWNKACGCETIYMFLAGSSIHCASCTEPYVRQRVRAEFEESCGHA